MLEGEISEINLIERLVELWREQFTGAIRFENDGIIKIVYFKSGDVLSASTNDRSDSIDEILMRAGKVSRDHVKQALAKRKENETLGDALLNLGFITRKELTWARRVQVVGVIRSIAAWETGSFTIVADYLPKRDEGTLFPLPQILVELIVTDQDRIKVERGLDSGNAVFSKAHDFDAVFRRLGLNEDADAIVAEVDGSKSAAEVAAASGKDTFNVYKLLYALATLRILSHAEKPQGELEFPVSDFGDAGVTDAADIWSEPPTPSLPTLEMDIADETQTFDAAPPPPSPSVSSSAWDEPEEEVSFGAQAEPLPETAMPAWESAPRRSVSVPMPAAIEPPAEAEEEQWGFDEAQIETAQRAASVPPIPPPAPSVVSSPSHLRRAPAASSRRYGLLVVLFVLAILGAAAYFGYAWWTGRPTEEPAPLQAQATPPPAVTPAPVQTGTVVELPTATATTTTSEPLTDGALSTAPVTESVSTATASPVPSTPVTTAPPVAAAASPNQALPAVVPRADPGKANYDAMAREYAANASGNFTVQVQILCDPSNLAKAIRDGGDQIWFVPQSLGTRSCYRVFWGRYPTREAAQAALNTIPASVRDRNSAVKPVPKP